MLPDYGVVVGQYVNYTTNQGQWMHVDLNINAANVQYQAAVDVNEPNGLFQYQVFNNLDLSLFGPIPALSDGWHHLDSNPASGAIDYVRSPILSEAAGLSRCILGDLERHLQDQPSDLDQRDGQRGWQRAGSHGDRLDQGICLRRTLYDRQGCA